MIEMKDGSVEDANAAASSSMAFVIAMSESVSSGNILSVSSFSGSKILMSDIV